MKKIFPFLFALFFAVPLFASTTPDAKESLQQGIDQLITTLKKPEYEKKENYDARDKEVLAIAKNLFDFKAFSRGALSSNWKRFSPQQQDQFSELFSKLIAFAYLDQLNSKSLEKIAITYRSVQELKPTRSGKLRTDISTTVSHDGVTTPVDYRLFNAGAGWRVYDVKIEGVSMIANYREQYRKKFAESPEKMIDDLKKKLGNRIEI